MTASSFGKNDYQPSGPGTITRITAHQVEVLWEDETAIRYRRAQLHNLRHPKLICELHGEWSAMFIDGVQESISPARSFCRTCVEPHCSRPPPGLESSSDVIRPGALYGCCRSKTETHTQDLPRYRARHAHWCIEAEAAEEARELLSAGADRCEIGDCANIEVERVEDRAVARPEPQRSACALPF